MLDYLTLEQMRDQAGRMIGDTSSSRDTKIDEWLNTSYDSCAKRHRWPQLIRASEGLISATSGNKYLYLDKYVGQLFFIFPSSHEGVAPAQMVENFFRRYGSTWDTSGPIESYAAMTEVGRKADFSSTAEKITVVSDNASDTNVDVMIRGMSSGGTDEIHETINTNGTTGVETTATYSDLLSASSNQPHRLPSK